MEFYVYVKWPKTAKWCNSGEGPWSTRKEALAFASLEVGVPWKIIGKTRKPMFQMTDATAAELATRITERIKDMYLCGAFDEKMDLRETAVEVLDEIRRVPKWQHR